MSSAALAVERPAPIALHLMVGEAAGLSIGGELYEVGPPEYEGGYEVTPSSEPQELPTAGHLMLDNVTVGAIPSNYGLITWNGSALTVS